jgi:hypothetical protein
VNNQSIQSGVTVAVMLVVGLALVTMVKFGRKTPNVGGGTVMPDIHVSVLLPNSKGERSIQVRNKGTESLFNLKLVLTYRNDAGEMEVTWLRVTQ